MKQIIKKLSRNKQVIFTLMLLGFTELLLAQAKGGVGGINAAASEIKGYIDPVTTLIYALGGVVGIVGAVKIYMAFNNGDEVAKPMMLWGGGFVFLMVAPTVVKSFFG